METGKICKRCALREGYCLEGYFMGKAQYSKTATFNTINKEGFCRECEKELAIQAFNNIK